jgi:hypothetical protein
MKKPNLKKPSLKKPQLRSDLKPPQFAVDLYSDLRDRHLLPLVILLVVGILAAPILLSGGGEEEEGFEGGPVTTEEQAASFAVVPSEPGLRDYRRRLGHRNARNPFAQPAPRRGGGGDASVVVASGGEDIVVTGGSSEASTGGSVPSGGSESSSTTTNTTTVTQVVAESTVTGHAIEVNAGFLGDLKVKGGIEPMTTLPSEKNPVLTFVGPSKDGKGAIFLMDSNVTAYYGKAKCALDELACTTVEVKPGESATFAYGYGKTRFKLNLKRLYPIVERSQDAASVTETDRFSK